MSTISGFLLDGGALSKEQEEKLLSNPKVSAIAQAVRVLTAVTAKVPFVEDLGSQIKKAFEMPITDAVIGAWKVRSELREFTDPAKHPPQEQNTYHLTDFTVKSSYKPRLEARFNGKVFPIELEAEIAIKVESGSLLIEGGRIWELRLGQITGSGTLSVAGTEAAKKEGKPLQLPGVVKFDQGIPILV